MAKMREAHWIKRMHVFDPDEHECSACGRRFRQPAPSYPACGIKMKGMKDPQDWVEEMEMLDIMLGDGLKGGNIEKQCIRRLVE